VRRPKFQISDFEEMACKYLALGPLTKLVVARTAVPNALSLVGEIQRARKPYPVERCRSDPIRASGLCGLFLVFGVERVGYFREDLRLLLLTA
jgi:hypothetical protein